MRSARKLSSGLKIAAVLVVGGMSLSACATRGFVREYVDGQIAGVNQRISAVEASARDGIQRADAANSAAQSAASAAQQANSAAQSAAASAQQANQRLDQLTTRVDTIEQQAAAARQPRN